MLTQPSNEDIRDELLDQSKQIFDVVGLGGAVGPTMYQFVRYRPLGWPYPQRLLKLFGLPVNAAGWHELLQGFGFMPPTMSEIQTTVLRAREAAPSKPSIPYEDESWPELEGTWTEEVNHIKLEDGSYLRREKRVFHIR